jgi:AraC-like DNA-binding protein
MLYTEIRPRLELARFIECFWILEGDASSQTERILPDGCAELILNFGARFIEYDDAGNAERQPLNFLVGQITRPILIAPSGTVQLIGIRFHPGGTFPFFRFPMHEITNNIVEVGALGHSIERDLVDRAWDEPSLLQKVTAVENSLFERARNCKHDSWIVGLAARIVDHRGRVSVDSLALLAGVTSRQLERRFLQEVGISPKLLCRILRFQQIFRAVNENDGRWAVVAADCGYYDQAHLIRDFKLFARQTPVVFLKQRSALTEAFTRKKRASLFSNTPA